ncbi:hypothetical protein EJ04DRAFT_554288 [Polyplosphaeria fusca]|uniref:ADF-H domain-containing protein n=1 Tax=Polyplosphaeria fusca TaxID=682080 RepID=A0A9P4QQV1_9PLEO|nr:hypothetical protein EJ04DRAFT_554288 [Polyplosphaeria fusca]
MDTTSCAFPNTIVDAFNKFSVDESQFALPLKYTQGALQPQPPIPFPIGPSPDFKGGLNAIESILSTRIPLYLVLRRGGTFVVITYIPYLADTKLKDVYLSNRNNLIQSLGVTRFSLAFIAKEPVEVYDYRSWEEKDMKAAACEDCESCVDGSAKYSGMKDIGYQKTKCRLCDQRMKNEVSQEASEAIQQLAEIGDCVQLTLDISTEIIELGFRDKNVSPTDLARRFPQNIPSYTFYRHPSGLLYFVFCSPDSAPVKARMSSIMAMLGFVSITAKNMGVNIDQKLEIHDGADLEFSGEDTRVGKYRSLYGLNKSEGTETVWTNPQQPRLPWDYQPTADQIGADGQ